jgi:hypothetical protein
MSAADPLLRAEFEALTARAGLAIPPDRDEAMFAGFLGQRRLLALLHRSFAYTDEPVFIDGVAR